jgi:hypothetical protein
MAGKTNIHLVPTEGEEWALREEVSGRDLGHYSAFREAEAVARKAARSRKVKLIVHLAGRFEVHDYRPWYLRWFESS